MSNIINSREVATYTFATDDYSFVMDKRSNTIKGLFVSPKFADAVKEYIDELKEQKTKTKIDSYDKFIGKFSGDTENKTSKEIKATKK